MTTIKQIEKKIEIIKGRNRKVEADKAWERSKVRKALIMLFTYVAMGVYMFAVGITHPWINAVVPTIAFMFATMTMPYFKRIWIERIYTTG